MRLPVLRCMLHLKRVMSLAASARCLVTRPCTRARHLRQLLGCSSRFMSAFTSSSRNPNCVKMASKGVRSSQAISMMRSMSSGLSTIQQQHERLFVRVSHPTFTPNTYPTAAVKPIATVPQKVMRNTAFSTPEPPVLAAMPPKTPRNIKANA